MNIGSDEIFNQTQQQSFTARDYAQSGLLAMWDAIENNGFRSHDQSAAIWKDLAGNYDLTVNSNVARFSNDCLVVHTHPTSDSLTNAPAYHPTAVLPANDDLEFEVVYSVNKDYDDNFAACVLLGGGASTTDATRSRNVVLVQYLKQYGRQFTASCTSTKVLSYNNENATLAAGRHSYSSGMNRTRPLFDGAEVAGSSVYDAYPLTLANAKLSVGGLKMYSNNLLPVGCGICNVRVYSRHLSLEERLRNFQIDKQRFGI